MVNVHVSGAGLSKHYHTLMVNVHISGHNAQVSTGDYEDCVSQRVRLVQNHMQT